MSLAYAAALVDTITTTLAAAEVPDVVVTVDPELIPGHIGTTAVVFVQAPRIEYETYSQHTCTWTVLVIAEHPDTLTAWAELDKLSDALAEPLDVDTAEPVTFQPPTGTGWPALSLTLTTHHTI